MDEFPPVGKPGRPPLDPSGNPAVRVNAIWLSPADYEKYQEVERRVADIEGITLAAARRTLLMSGVRQRATQLGVLDEFKGT